mgnify:CR=1 FL=1
MKQQLKNLFNCETVLIPLRGYINNNDYSKAKTPIVVGWTTPEYKGLTTQEAEEHLAKGGWVGLRIPQGYILVDIDNKKHGELLNELLEKLNIKAFIIETPNGWQFFFRDNGKVKEQKVKTLTKGLFVVDYRLQEKGYTVLPTENTENRRWVYYDTYCDPLPFFLEPLRPAKDDNIDLPILQGARNDTLFRHVSRLRDYIKDEEEIRKTIYFIAEHLCNPPLSGKEVETITKPRPGYNYELPGGQVELKDGFRPSDVWNAENFAKKYQGKLLWCSSWGSWLVYENGKWKEDHKESVLRMAKELIMDYYRKASEMEDDQERKRLGKHALQSESQRRIKAMIELAKSELAITPEEFDKNPYIVNFLNGTLDLETFEFREHNPEDFLTKQMNVKYNPDADCPKWLDFLNLIFKGDQELIDFVQGALGYSLTGDVREDCLFICWGSGQNGKTTFLKTILEIWGDYGADTPTETFLSKKYEGVPNDIARLSGKRFVVASETPEGKRFNEVLIKKLTGRDRITARFLRQEFFEFEPTFKIWIITNHKPIVHESTKAFWRRIKLIPFTYTIPDDKKIPGYEKILLEERSGILNWVLEGFWKWKSEGLRTPKAVQEATENYRDEMDILADFITECCEEGEGKSVLNSELYEAYKDWCFKNGEEPLSQRGFSLRLQERGYKNKKFSGGKRGWEGITLKRETNSNK